MEDFRNRPPGNYSTTASWEELHALTRHWVSDLRFYQDDLRFLHRLIDKYFIWITDQGNLHCLDAKINIEGNALYRQPEIIKMRDLSQEDEREREAEEEEVLADELLRIAGLVNYERLATAGSVSSAAAASAVLLAAGSLAISKAPYSTPV